MFEKIVAEHVGRITYLGLWVIEERVKISLKSIKIGNVSWKAERIMIIEVRSQITSQSLCSVNGGPSTKLNRAASKWKEQSTPL